MPEFAVSVPLSGAVQKPDLSSGHSGVVNERNATTFGILAAVLHCSTLGGLRRSLRGLPTEVPIGRQRECLVRGTHQIGFERFAAASRQFLRHGKGRTRGRRQQRRTNSEIMPLQKRIDESAPHRDAGHRKQSVPIAAKRRRGAKPPADTPTLITRERSISGRFARKSIDALRSAAPAVPPAT